MLPAPGWITDCVVVNQLIVRPTFWGVIAAVFSQFITENMISLKLQRSVFYTSNKAFAYEVCWLHVGVRCDLQKKILKNKHMFRFHVPNPCVHTSPPFKTDQEMTVNATENTQNNKWPRWTLETSHTIASTLTAVYLEQEEHLKLDFSPLVHCLWSTLTQTR